MRHILPITVVLLMFLPLVAMPSCSGDEDQATQDIFCVSLGWMANESGKRQRQGFEDAFKAFGDKGVFENAEYSSKAQSEQIDAFIKMRPKAIFVTPSDPAGITEACKRVVEAGIPLYVADAIIAGVPAKTSICSSDYRMGDYTMRYIAAKLGGKGRVGMIDLPGNESWDQRGQGAREAARDYPGIKIVQTFSFDSEASITPRQAVDNMLTANPKGKLDAIWCAWDEAAMEGALAIIAAGRQDEIITTGIDGSKAAFAVIKQGGPFKLCMAQSIHYMSYQCVVLAHKQLEGKQVPRFIFSPVYAVDKELLDKLPEDKKAWEYDMPGKGKEFGWVPVL